MRNSCRAVLISAVLLAFASAAFVAVAPAAAASRTNRSTVLNVLAGFPTEFKFAFRVPVGGKPGQVPLGTVVFKVRNAGKLAHTFKVCSSPGKITANSCAGTGTATIAPGKTATLAITFKKKGTYEYLCTVPGHAAAGMKGPLTVG